MYGQCEEGVRAMRSAPVRAGTAAHINRHVKATARRLIDLLLQIRPAHLKHNETALHWRIRLQTRL